ncbi:hypothetical protein MAPG_09627 [Magnaporthiopsis poae ATCC 64411]|uniref:ZZ-type domain-containing protein n=1 Tax=Magnaporthiopsis poae (strain ATCC 64411 / 73-15) TaxID=644358 RepID=A0A0C4EAF7_MAGP6|nr:hypothetical protein MAPG_09627 [Magnaporthiopsis poae ATCC 64411]
MVWYDFPAFDEDEYANRISAYTSEQLSALSAQARRQVYLIRREQKLLEAELAKRRAVVVPSLCGNQNRSGDSNVSIISGDAVEAEAGAGIGSSAQSTSSLLVARGTIGNNNNNNNPAVNALAENNSLLQVRLQTTRGARKPGLGIWDLDYTSSDEFSRILHFGQNLGHNNPAAPDPYEAYRAWSELIKSVNGFIDLKALVKAWTAATAALKLPWRTYDTLLGCLKATNAEKCLGLMGLPMGCDHCADKIENGDYWHCCECGGYHVCLECYGNGRRCLQATHAMTNVRVVKTAQTFLGESAFSAYSRWTVTEATPVMSRQLLDGSYSMFCCSECDVQVFQGLNYHCPDCPPPGYDACERCFTNGARCTGADHKLVVAPAALDCSRNPRVVGDCHRRSKGADELLLLASGRVGAITCDACDGEISQGCFYHCCNCDNDDLDLCHSCYASGSRCKNPISHTLQLCLADAMDHLCLSKDWPVACQRRSSGLLPRDMKGQGHCSLCGNLLIDDVCFWHCCVCYVNGKYDDFDICRSCYREGAGCDDRLHRLTCHSLD